MSGFDVSREIRAIGPPFSEIPIIGVTSSAAEGTSDKYLESGMNDHIMKPWKVEHLKQKLAEWLGDD